MDPSEPPGRLIAGTVTAVISFSGIFGAVVYGHSAAISELSNPTIGSIPGVVSAIIVGLAVSLMGFIGVMLGVGLVSQFDKPEFGGLSSYTLVGLGGLIGAVAGSVAIITSSISTGDGGTTDMLIGLGAVALPSLLLSYNMWRPADVGRVGNGDGNDFNPDEIKEKRVQFTKTTDRRAPTESSDPTFDDEVVNEVEGMNTSEEYQDNDNVTNNGTTGHANEARTEGDDDMVQDEFEYQWTNASDVSFADVGGMDEVKRELKRDIVKPLTTDREKAKELDIPVPNILFHGPPGTGKTFLAKALATELGLPFAMLSGSDVQSKWINESAEKINKLFSEASRMSAKEGGAVVFIDELDSVLKKRSDGSGSHNEDSKVVNEFLTQLQESRDDDIVFIGATNRVDMLDEAGTRSGRIDKEYEIGKPDAKARKSIINSQLNNRPTEINESDLSKIAEMTDGLVAADLESIVVEAARHSAFERDDNVITREDLFAGLKSNT